MPNWPTDPIYEEMTSPADGDKVLVNDVSESTVGKKIKWITWENIRAWIKTWMNTLVETSGPTVLTTGAIADGEYLKRDGTSIVGGTPELSITAAPASDHLASGVKIRLTAAATMAFGDVGYIASTEKVALIDADAIASMSGVVMCVDASISADAEGNFLLIGIARDDTWNWTVGGLIYGTVTGTSGNTLSQTQPSGADDVIQILGVATHADRMLFNPSLIQIEHT
ncbi:MAG: hypothetical protein CVU43_09735 [Chloroflexi bacterium HGW-Chloroflexi-5]|jgi:hypothetical protein|nr:MAG: hypothetical protein CVU43_09735 [Chloroflexi bacterium HGW-Chloroflexi-5]